MRVLHLGKYYPPDPGGMETFLRDLLHASLRAGLEVAALVHAWRPGLRSSSETRHTADGDLQLTRAAIWGRLLFTPISPAFPLQLRRLLRQFQPGIVHVHLPAPSAFWLLLSPAARRVPWVAHWHADAIDERAGTLLRGVYRWLYRPLQSALLRRTRAIIVTSPPYLESSPALREFHDRCVVVPLGLDAQTLHAAAPTALPADNVPGEIRLLAVGRLTYYKGLDVLLRAVAAVPEARLRIVGVGEDGERLRHLADELGLAGRVAFLGGLDDAALAREYQACDCLCLASTERSEAFGLVLLEAMSFARPLIASEIPGSGVGWVVEEGVNGLKVPPGDVPAWSAAIRRLAGDTALRQRLGATGCARFEERFAIDACMRGVGDVYRQVLEVAA
ncbi:glycosyltransferase [Mangrovimicrobium sediminis]|uniref:Glycosyltransferase n=1 Tax=Mangrovimicrobium sediminis TaxID=2562682 RepID=A0A4Z0M253_9GAMM|nr:glycosyltransferase [Haliea sp. SAOS-164]TGD73507.1 glycosyltransferase [Haliea sp. SAOS-164]